MVEKCKFCGAKQQVADVSSIYFECETVYRIDIDYWDKSAECVGATIGGYRRLFPIPPKDESPITPEVCERLGMRDCGDGMWTVLGGFPTVFFSTHEPPQSKIWLNNFTIHDMTAGQLSLLVAFGNSREAQKKGVRTPA